MSPKCIKTACGISLIFSLIASAFAGEPKTSGPVEVLNKGLGGQTAQQGLGRFDRDVLDCKPQWLILYFGINDALNQNVPLDGFVDAMQEMIDRARSGGVKHVILVTPNPFIETYLIERHPEHAEAKGMNGHLEKYEVAIRQMAQKNKLPIVDLKKMVLDNGGATEKKASLIRNPFNSNARDGIHLTAKGYKLFADLFEPVFKGNIQTGDTVVCLGDSLTFGTAMKGEGTSTGETYPAFLKVLLNSMIAGKEPAPPQGSAEATLKNDQISVRFNSPEEGAGIAQIQNARGFEFLHRAGRAPLWKMLLRRLPGNDPKSGEWATMTVDPEKDDGTDSSNSGADRETIEINSLQAPAKLTKKDGQLVFVWENLDVGDEKGVLSVTIEANLAPSDPFARFRGRFSLTGKKYTVFYFHAPCVEGIYPKDGRLDLDRLASPIYNGRLILNPIENGILGKPTYFMPNRGGHSMQFDAYYHEGNGLYLGAFDGEQNAVRYAMKAGWDGGLGWAMVHVPNNMTATPQNWATPYDTVIRCFDGDWYDACRIYREWALKQTWTAEGPMATRTSTPQWFKDIDEWLLLPVSRSYMGPRMANGMGLGGFKDQLDGFNIGLSINAWGKHQLFDKLTPDRFPLTGLDQEFFSEWRQEPEYPMMAYIQAISWDMTLPDFRESNARDFCVKNYSGQSLRWVEQLAVMYPSPFWQEKLGGVVEKMAGEAGFKAAYLDSGNHGGTYLNFNPKCSKDVGGGNSYIKGMQKMMLDIKAKARQIQPEFCFSAESFWEGNIAVLDGFLACNTTNIKLEKGKYIAVPMAQTVYHDYTILFSSWVGKYDLSQPGALGYLAKFGQTFVWGVKPAWNQINFLTTYENHEIAMESSLKRYAAYAASRKFLQSGEMLRAPKFAEAVPEVDFKWYVSWGTEYFDVALPQVVHSLWRAPDGNLGLVFYNIGSTPITVKAVLDDPAYELASKDVLHCTQVYPKSESGVTAAKIPGGGFVIEATVPAASPLVVEMPRL